MGPLVVFTFPGHQRLSRDILVHLLEHLEDYYCWSFNQRPKEPDDRSPIRNACITRGMSVRDSSDLGFPTWDGLRTLYEHQLTYKDQVDATPFGVIRSRWLKKSMIEPQGWRITLALRLLAGP
ncbi:hypothetical protein B296_00033160 [Ensete ventricosum]|uniref:Uncharacterized protein n=1 Tax=Ensete ventricosum TaxID=4639 RepID=A0A427AAB2_ENSVE|nr:hypothetical protein B296_00033160 [Ensete ventricosum]